jgi:cation diffusion facilitator family transporter
VPLSEDDQQTVLWVLLAINGAMFVLEAVTGWLAQSTGLVADSLDMLADATVYGISLYAVGRQASTKVHAARLSGVFQIVLALIVLFDVIRRFFLGSEPVSMLMMGVGAVAFGANLTCLALIAKHRNGEVHMRASWIFSVNDVLANLGVIAAGGLVLLLGSRLPDLIIGFVISLLVLRGGLRIIEEARAAETVAAELST